MNCRNASPNVPGRAVSPEQKRAVIERIYAAWLKMPEQRLGQLIENAAAHAECPRIPFYTEDDALAEAAEMWAAERAPHRITPATER